MNNNIRGTLLFAKKESTRNPLWIVTWQHTGIQAGNIRLGVDGKFVYDTIHNHTFHDGELMAYAKDIEAFIEYLNCFKDEITR